MRGRKPVPTELHKLRGTLNATRHASRKNEAKAEGSLFDAPDWLSDDQKASWRYAVEHAPKGVLKHIDRALLAIWVEAEDRHRTATVMQNKMDNGRDLKLLTKTKAGVVSASPYLGIASRAAQTMIKAASEMGFSPASRSRIHADDHGNRDTAPGDEGTVWDKLKVIRGGKTA